MYQKILVPLDGSTLSELALPHAEALARHFESEFYPTMAGVAYDYQLDLQTQVEKEVKEYIINWQKRLQWAKLKCRYLVLEGFVPEAILKVAETEAVDLIVMSTHGRSGLSRWVYGSVAAKILQAAPCPIFLVRAKNHPGDD
jgi:nucleotide-binding universal stress UspA family protein